MRPPGATLAVAFSGGRDSLALLHVTTHAAAALGLQVVALHVHHGLMAEADAWLADAQALCDRWAKRGLPLRLRWHRVAGQPAPGDSIEAWARRNRYEALERMAREAGASIVLLAHHRRDQAETVLLQALRGSGARGLSGMPSAALRHGLVWARPWLQQPREAIEAYVLRHRLRAVEDPSNEHIRLSRNRLRLQVWPALTAAFADAESTLCTVAERAQEADAALRELAALDLHGRVDAAGLDLRGLSTLSRARRANALRDWLSRELPAGAPNTLVTRLLDEAFERSSGRWHATPGTALSLYRGRLSLVAMALPPSGEAMLLDLSQPGLVPVPGWGGCFKITAAAAGTGLPQGACVLAQLRARQGGERFQRAPKALARSLKKQYQAAHIGELQRRGPLVWLAGQLAFVPGLGVDARWWSRHPDQPRLQWQWLPDSSCSDADG